LILRKISDAKPMLRDALRSLRCYRCFAPIELL
jgi:hypothetical protein